VNRNVRNAAIVLAIAGAVYAVPGGGTAGNVVASLLSLILLGGLLFFAARLYMEHRVTLFGLGDQRRLMLYGALGVALLAAAGTSRMWDTGIGAALWFALMLGALAATYSVWRSTREY